MTLSHLKHIKTYKRHSRIHALAHALTMNYYLLSVLRMERGALEAFPLYNYIAFITVSNTIAVAVADAVKSLVFKFIFGILMLTQR